MKKIHLETCHSTQTYLKEYLQNHDDRGDILVTADHQLQGYGRSNNQWEHFPGSLAMSFGLKANPEITLTSLEMGLIVAEFFDEFYNISLKLKWPNDIMLETKEKCGGILVHLTSGQWAVVGLGINFYNQSVDLKKTEYGFIHLGNIPSDFSENLYRYILSHRKKPEQVLEGWTSRCIHLNQNVSLNDSEKKVEGKFEGIGTLGEAIIDGKKYITGSMELKN